MAAIFNIKRVVCLKWLVTFENQKSHQTKAGENWAISILLGVLYTYSITFNISEN